jgi:DivIVA domain-containing protein
MEVSPKTLREITFREKMRGYHPEDVDTFLEQVAVGVEALQDRLRQAVDRAQRAESAATDTGDTDQALRKTLVLAQRTADMAVQEAREQASRILASAEQQAQSMLAEAEDRGRRTLEETITECKAELSRLESTRAQAQQDVDTLQRWLDEHKEHLRSSLADAISAVDRAGVLWPAPSTRSVDPGRRPMPSGSPFESSGATTADSGPDTVMWSPAEALDEPVGPSREALREAQPARDAQPARQAQPARDAQPGREARAAREVQAAREPANNGPVIIDDGTDPDQEAMDNFFDEDRDDLDEEPRFGGRLRRRR